mgnify:CR=1 FL=1
MGKIIDRNEKWKIGKIKSNNTAISTTSRSMHINFSKSKYVNCLTKIHSRLICLFSQEARDKLEIANENIRSDLERWNQEKKIELKKILINFAELHISHYEQVTIIIIIIKNLSWGKPPPLHGSINFVILFYFTVSSSMDGSRFTKSK